MLRGAEWDGYVQGRRSPFVMLREAEWDGYVQGRRSPFVMLRGAKRSRSTQAQRLSENPEPGSRDFARDDEGCATRDDEGCAARDDELTHEAIECPLPHSLGAG